MFESEGNQAAIVRACQAAVGRLLVERDWHLLEATEWIDRTFAQVQVRPESDPRRVAMHIYSQALYTACSGTQSDQRRERGYEELFRYLFDVARKRYPLICDDVAQQTIELVYERFAKCRNPGTFLAFTLQQMSAAARTIFQPRGTNRQIREPIEQAAKSTYQARDQQPDLVAPMIADELRARFDRLSEEFLRKHPRAKQQLEALRLKYIEELDEATISQRLNKPPASVYVLRSRAIDKLRAEPEWRALAIEFGVLPEDK
jgi:RNA polymerase sigma factor (sigma-70 family)